MRHSVARSGFAECQFSGAGDLSRFFGGVVVPGSVQARATEWNEPAGKLAKVPPPVDESKVPEAQRIPRVTSANW